MRRSIATSRVRVCAIISSIACIVGCATTADLAPPVTEQTLTVAMSMGFDAESVAEGRRLYVTACVQCHSPEAVTRYSWEQWGAIIPRMADESDLNSTEKQALSAYIRATLGVRDLNKIPGENPGSGPKM